VHTYVEEDDQIYSEGAYDDTTFTGVKDSFKDKVLLIIKISDQGNELTQSEVKMLALKRVVKAMGGKLKVSSEFD